MMLVVYCLCIAVVCLSHDIIDRIRLYRDVDDERVGEWMAGTFASMRLAFAAEMTNDK
jgi:hypothetical protein